MALSRPSSMGGDRVTQSSSCGALSIEPMDGYASPTRALHPGIPTHLSHRFRDITSTLCRIASHNPTSQAGEEGTDDETAGQRDGRWDGGSHQVVYQAALCQGIKAGCYSDAVLDAPMHSSAWHTAMHEHQGDLVASSSVVTMRRWSAMARSCTCWVG